MESTLKLLINGKEVGLRDFPERVLKDTILAFVNNLKLEENPKEIIIELKINGKEDRRI